MTTTPSVTMLDFPKFSDPKRSFRNLGLTPQEIESVLAQQYGLTVGIQREFPDRVTRGDGEMLAVYKALYAFEHYSRDCSYDRIADALEVSVDTAYQYMVQAREAVKQCFGLEIMTAKEQVRLVSSNDLREQTTRFVSFINDEVVPRMAKVEKFCSSLRAANQPVMLPAKAAAFLAAAATPEGDDGYVSV